MKKTISLIKACMTDNMNIFKIKSKSQKKSSKMLLPIFLFICIFFTIWSYANMIMEPLVEVHLEYVLITIFVLLTFILTLVEGIYKSSSLLFNCKDDNLLLSLPIKKSTVLFIRIFKFYVFELIYNSMFMLPAILVYARYVPVEFNYYITSLIMLILLPIIPIVISCIIGAFISMTSSKFRYKNIAQIIITTILLLVILYFSFNIEGILKNIATKATNINDFITRIYYPAGVYHKLLISFNIKDLLIFIAINILIFVLSIKIVSNVYFKINSNVKSVATNNKNRNYKITYHRIMPSLIKKEFQRFITSPVFIINAGFGLVLYIVASIGLVLKFDSIKSGIIIEGEMLSFDIITSYFSVIIFILICTTSFMTSITSSMISLEGKSFNILKSLPITPFKIINSKVLSALYIMVPCILLGNIIIFIKFKLSLIEILLLLISSLVLPAISSIIGIIINLKYPKMDAENDTEVVKQSMSSMVAVFSGMGIIAITVLIISKLIQKGVANNIILLGSLSIYIIILGVLMLYLKNYSTKAFESINV